MEPIEVLIPCIVCYGTGIAYYTPSAPALPYEENPCSKCGGTGLMTSQFSISSDVFDNLKAKVKDIDDRTKDIWNKVKNLP